MKANGLAYVLALGTCALAVLTAYATEKATAYFPESLNNLSVLCPRGWRERAMDEHLASWFGSQLQAANETALWQLAPEYVGTDRHILRFTWLRTFEHPVFVTVSWWGTSTPRLKAEILTGMGGYEPGKESRRVDRPLTASEFSRVRESLHSARLDQAAPVECGLGTDGSEWVFEEVDATGYHFQRRWTPSFGAIKNLGVTLISLTPWASERVY